MGNRLTGLWQGGVLGWLSGVVVAALTMGGCGQVSRNHGGASGGSGGALASSEGGASPSGGNGSSRGGRSNAGGEPSAGNAGEASGGIGGGSMNANVYTAELRGSPDKVDLLLMIDNSMSMADKQAVLADAVGSVLNRLAMPACMADGRPTGASADASGACANGAPEFPPVRDIHIGVVSSSLGAHGGQTCSRPEDDDRGQLVPLVRPSLNLPTWNQSGFLFWDPGARGQPPGEGDLQTLQARFRDMVFGVGETGCGYESSLEAWYRFLIDPQPILSTPEVVGAGATRPVYNADPATNPVLKQRAAFLRPDSVVVVVMLSDENDCSVIDEGQGWLVGLQTLNNSAFRMPRATSACAKNPNDPCCVPCAAVPSAVPAGCALPAEDATCQAGMYYAAPDDSLNLRCYRQKERFGFELLYPIQRYVNGLSQPMIANRDGVLVPNPLFANREGLPRDRSLVHLVGIVGVPWQDVAVDANAPLLVYKSYKDIDWDLILGSPGNASTPPTLPRDRLMYETTLDRTTLFGSQPHPVIGQAGALAPATSSGRPNGINGHETNVVRADELQYACIFALPTPRTNCAGAGCDCEPGTADYNRAVCEQGTQTHAKAYPGIRELQVLKDFGAVSSGNAVVASICPKTLSVSKTDASYGYNPAVAALIEQLRQNLGPRCFPRQLTLDENGQVPCSVVEGNAPAVGQACAACEVAAGRGAVTPSTRAAVLNQLRVAGACDGAGQPACESMCLCALNQYDGSDLRTCQSSSMSPVGLRPGFCYVDPSQTGDPARRLDESGLVTNCPVTEKRLIRVLGDDSPRKGVTVTLACDAQAARP